MKTIPKLASKYVFIFLRKLIFFFKTIFFHWEKKKFRRHVLSYAARRDQPSSPMAFFAFVLFLLSMNSFVGGCSWCDVIFCMV